MSHLTFRLPSRPYPGLRPFFEHESSLLQGRARQVAEVITRLRESQFVAVVGGSGCGKSSLIRAGVVPELRAFGLPEAGDYWVPIVVTPGTSRVPGGFDWDALNGSHEQEVETPITRLARKIEAVLDPVEKTIQRQGQDDGSATPPAAELARESRLRREHISSLLRQPAGFHRVARSYHEELPRLGPDTEHARFLIVIDQFEELFHPNNEDNPDAKALIQAVIDHFFNPHPRCYVVMTMRSERLADCAGYLELPDAINKSMYLVRRLDADELHDAIVGPTQYFLRLTARRDMQRRRDLPTEIEFSEEVITRLLADVDPLTCDPDHLPLLQHVLARIWEAACKRAQVDGQEHLPATIEWADLEIATDPTQLPNGWLRNQPGTNTLRASLEKWADHTYMQRPKAERKLLDVALRQLAFRDPNTGHYMQQRLVVDKQLISPAVPDMAAVQNVFEQGFFSPANYLFWDRDNPERATLKVSHESFIRGWTHFRKLVDQEADRFEEFLSLLRKCAMWSGEKKVSLLLESSELSRLEAADLVKVFEDQTEREEWFRVLRQYRDGDRLAAFEMELDNFLSLSRSRRDARERVMQEAAERQREAEERERAARYEKAAQEKAFEAERRVFEAERRAAETEKAAQELEHQKDRQAAAARQRQWFLIGGTALLGVVTVCLLLGAFVFVQSPVLAAVDRFSSARKLAELPIAGGSESNTALGYENTLRDMVRAATLVEQGHGERRRFERVVYSGLTNGRSILEKSSSEGLVNGKLRAVLTNSYWRSTKAPREQVKAERREVPCTVNYQKQPVSGSLVTFASGTSLLFSPVNDEIALHLAKFNGKDCIASAIGWSVPKYLQPQLRIDGTGRHVSVAIVRAGSPSVSLYRIEQKREANGELTPSLDFRAVLTDSESVGNFRAAVEGGRSKDGGHIHVPELQVLPTWYDGGELMIHAGSQSWTIVSDEVRLLKEPENPADWVTPTTDLGNSGCVKLKEQLEMRPQAGFKSQMLRHGDVCLQVQRGNPGPSAGAAPLQEKVLLAVYREPNLAWDDLDKKVLPSAIATVSMIGTVNNSIEWLLGERGDAKGWVAYRETDASGRTRYFGAPWSTAALRRLAEKVMPVADTRAPGPPTPLVPTGGAPSS